MNNITARMNYDNARAALIKAFGNTPGFKVDNYKVTQSYLRLEAALAVGPTTYQFLPLINQGTPFNTEQRLNLQDSFVISQIGMFITNPSSSTDSSVIMQTYPDPLIFATANVVPQLNKIYSGQINFRVNNDVLLPSWDVARHYFVPQTQTAVLLAGTNAAAVNNYDQAENGFYAMEPNIILVGSKNNQISLTLPEGLTVLEPDSRVVLFLRGHLIQNSTVVS